mgnify:CR=1 FL=1
MSKPLIQAIYYICLPEKEDNWKALHAELSKFTDAELIKFDAVDTRTKEQAISELANYEVSLNPIGDVAKVYFSQGFGAVGCYLSHYAIWQDILARGFESVLILEDDIRIVDVCKFMTGGQYTVLNNHKLLNCDLIQLNKRNRNPIAHDHLGIDRELSWKKCLKETEGLFGVLTNHDMDVRFNYVHEGTESYVIFPEGCKSLVTATRTPGTLFDRLNPDAQPSWPYKKTHFLASDWDFDGSAIVAAVDKFIGYCNAHGYLNMTYYPLLGLRDEQSTIGWENIAKWKKSRLEYYYTNDEDYMWWTK